MLSLREKLKAAGQASKAKPAAPRAEDCLLRETRFPLADFELTAVLPGAALSLLTGKEHADCRREEICFLDTETTGLSHGAGTVAFLVGVGSFGPEGFTVRQYLMRDYDEEVFLLEHTARHMEESALLCTFNGAAFDLPLLESRLTMQRMRERICARPHVDLLPVARRVWKLRLRKCSLSSLEEAVLGLRREGDLPGAQVPERYFSFLRTRDASLLEDILRHNAQDVVSMAHILNRLMRLHETPLLAEAAEDLFSLGKICEKRGKTESARMCYRAADRGTVSLLARSRMAESFRKTGDWREAQRIYQLMIDEKQGGAAPLIAMAKICEHKTKDLSAAAEFARRALALAAERPGVDLPLVQKRYRRLLLKARKEGQKHGNSGWIQGKESADGPSEGARGGGAGGI